MGPIYVLLILCVGTTWFYIIFQDKKSLQYALVLKVHQNIVIWK